MPDRMHRFADLTTTPWRNGLGRKADIVAGEGWSLSYAWIEGEAPFSDYPGQDRTITLLDGAGFRLDFAGHLPLLVDKPEVPRSFGGDWPAHCLPLDGPCFVVNIIAERARWHHAVEVMRVAGEVALTPLGGPCLAVVLAGEVTLPDGSTAGRLDTVPVPGRLVLQAAEARIALARLRPVG